MSDKKLVDKIMINVERLPYNRQVELLEMINKWLNGDKRIYERKSVKIPISVVSEDQILQKTTRDISDGGTFFHTDDVDRFQINQMISVIINLSKTDRSFQFRGKVVGIRSNGIAVKFDEVNPYLSDCIDEEILQVG